MSATYVPKLAIVLLNLNTKRVVVTLGWFCCRELGELGEGKEGKVRDGTCRCSLVHLRGSMSPEWQGNNLLAHMVGLEWIVGGGGCSRRQRLALSSRCLIGGGQRRQTPRTLRPLR